MSADFEQFKSNSLQQLCNEIIEVMELNLKAKQIRLKTDYQANPVFYGDAIQIQQVLINLFNNAIDALVSANIDTKEIKLTIAQNDGFASLRIEDSGSGIPEAILPAIFELYKTTKKSGLGVGLWLSRTIVEKHNGTITAHHGSQGGAVFQVLLPLAKEGAV